MSLFVGDVGNTANLCVLAAVVLSVAMIIWSEALRQSGIWLVTHAKRERDAFTARSFYRWAWLLARVAPALLIGAVALQQARLQKTKVIAIDNGVAEVIAIANTGELNEWSRGMAVEQTAGSVADGGIGQEIVYTTASGSTVSWANNGGHSSPTRVFSGGSTAGSGRRGISGGVGESAVRGDGIDTLPIPGLNGRTVF